MKIAILGADNISVEICKKIIFSQEHKIFCVGYHKSMKDRAIPLIKWADENQIKIKDNLTEIISEVDMVLMINYPGIIRNEYLEDCLFLNVHNSLLPKYRGLHAMVWALLNDEKYIGYSIHQVVKEVDAGNIYYQDSKQISDSDDILILQEWQYNSMIKVFPSILNRIEDGYKGIEQQESGATYVTKRNKTDGRINWDWSARRIFNLIRAIRPPYTYGAYTFYNEEEIIITKSHCLPNPKYFMETGKIVAIKDQSVLIKCEDSLLSIDEIIYNGVICSPAKVMGTVGNKCN
ncbi:methionyl-tRNA formyltransferase [Lysinibacillus fusiformis]|uniref:methionyl-tRNA formyltransferase n=1 Tax=Lysinibacillus fusiformis TaxID=28031 RepID=UPI00379ECA9F